MFIANSKESSEIRKPKFTLKSFVEKAKVLEKDETNCSTTRHRCYIQHSNQNVVDLLLSLIRALGFSLVPHDKICRKS